MFSILLKVLANIIRKDKECKGMHIGRKSSSLYLQMAGNIHIKSKSLLKI
jgi:hypothetical protein